MDIRTWTVPTRLAVHRDEGLVWVAAALVAAVTFAVVLDSAGLFDPSVRRDRRGFIEVVLLLTLIATPFLGLPLAAARRANLTVDLAAEELRWFAYGSITNRRRTWKLTDMTRAYEVQRWWTGHAADAVVVELGGTSVLLRVRIGEADRLAASFNAVAGADHDAVRIETAHLRRGLFF